VSKFQLYAYHARAVIIGIKLMYKLMGEYKPMVTGGFVLAVPLAAIALQKLLSTMDYHIRLSWWMFALGRRRSRCHSLGHSNLPWD
jgi:hypothetical protein